MKRLALAIAGLALALPAIAQKTPTPDLLKRAFSTPTSTQLYSYDFEMVNVGDKGTATMRGHIDPSRRQGDRVTISFYEDTGEKPQTARKLDERMEKNADGDIFCDKLSREDITNAVDKGAAEGTRIFAFTPRPEADSDGATKDIIKKMAAQAVIDEASGTVRTFNATLTKPHNIMLIADVKTATMKADCALASNGRAYMTSMEFTASGGALGTNFSSRTVQTISNLAPDG